MVNLEARGINEEFVYTHNIYHHYENQPVDLKRVEVCTIIRGGAHRHIIINT